MSTEPNSTAVTDSSGRQLATFWLDQLLIGIDIRQIREINRVGSITPVPLAPKAVRGVINLRGEVVTVMDLRTILEMTPIEVSSTTRMAIVQSGDEQIALLVDRVADVVMTTPEMTERLPSNVSGIDSRYFESVYKLGHDLLVALNVDAALSEPVAA